MRAAESERVTTPAAADRNGGRGVATAPSSGRRRVDRAGVELAARDLLVALGADLDADGVERFARDLQLQERLTSQIAQCLQKELRPKGVGVVLEAEHLCISLRGVQNSGAKTITSALHGLVRDDPRTREEFLTLAGRRV